MDIFRPTRLYIKKHRLTGLKYFGKSIKQNLNTYNGSGKYWKKHIKKHGIKFVETIWISEWFYSRDEIIKFCENFCKENNIVTSNEWANLKEENGLDGGILSEQSLLSISNKLKGRSKDTHEYIRISAEKKSKTMRDRTGVYQKVGRIKIKKWLDSLSEKERKERLGHVVSEEQRKKLSIQRKGKTKKECNRVEKMSITKKHYYLNLSVTERKEKLGHSLGMKWYHNDNLKICKTLHKNNVSDGWLPGRKKYEDKKN